MFFAANAIVDNPNPNPNPNPYQAFWAEAWLAAHPALLSALDVDVTYLTEAVYRANRVVLRS